MNERVDIRVDREYKDDAPLPQKYVRVMTLGSNSPFGSVHCLAADTAGPVRVGPSLSKTLSAVAPRSSRVTH